jgi:hypothetical protein
MKEDESLLWYTIRNGNSSSCGKAGLAFVNCRKKRCCPAFIISQVAPLAVGKLSQRGRCDNKKRQPTMCGGGWSMTHHGMYLLIVTVIASLFLSPYSSCFICSFSAISTSKFRASYMTSVTSSPKTLCIQGLSIWVSAS